MVTDNIGGGIKMTVKVGPKGKEMRYGARVGILGTDLIVFTERDKLGHIGMRRWPQLIKVLPIGIRRKDFSKWYPKWLIVVDAGTLYNALRMMWNILLQEGITFKEGEKGVLSEALTLARELDTGILGVSKDNVDVYKRTWLEKVKQIKKLLGKPLFNLPKLETLAQLDEVLVGIDTLGRVNQSALLARSIAIQSRIEERSKEEIVAIQSVIVPRQSALNQLIFWSECYLDRAFNFLDTLFNDKVLENTDALARQRIARWLLFLAQDLIKVDLAPFVINFRLCYNEFENAQKLLLKKDFSSDTARRVIELLLRSRQSLMIKYIQRDLEDVILFCTKLLYQKEITIDQWEEIHKKLQLVYERLFAISEAGFRIQVKQRALSCLSVAISLIESKDAKLFSQAREWMKNTSSIL